MDLNKLKAFYFSAKANSFTNTKMNLSSSVISRHVSDLESLLNVKLFYRTKEGLVLSSHGQLLYEKTNFILNFIDETKREITKSKIDPKENLTVYFPTSWGSRFVIPGLNNLLKSYSKLRLNIVTEEKKPVFTKGQLEIALLPYVPEDTSLIRKHVTSLTLKLYASPLYIDKFGQPHTKEDLDKHQLIAASSRNDEFTDMNWHLKIGKIDEERIPYLRLSEPYYAATEGLGIASLAEENLLLKEEILVPILPDITGPKVNLYIVYPEYLRGVTAIKIFSKYLIDLVDQQYPNHD